MTKQALTPNVKYVDNQDYYNPDDFKHSVPPRFDSNNERLYTKNCAGMAIQKDENRPKEINIIVSNKLHWDKMGIRQLITWFIAREKEMVD